MLACTRTAISAWPGWSARPASRSRGLRPVLRCVTCRTLTSVLLQLRSASFAGPGQRPVTSRTAEDPPRSRVPAPHGTASPHNPRRHHKRGQASGPFTKVSTATVPAYARSSKGHLPRQRRRPSTSSLPAALRARREETGLRHRPAPAAARPGTVRRGPPTTARRRTTCAGGRRGHVARRDRTGRAPNRGRRCAAWTYRRARSSGGPAPVQRPAGSMSDEASAGS